MQQHNINTKYTSGADVYINQQKMGVTPYTYTDTKIVGSSTAIMLKKDGYQDMNIVLQRNEQADVGAIIGGIFVLVPFLWVCKYNPVHNYQLTPASGAVQEGATPPAIQAVPNTVQPANKTADPSVELSKIKNLYDGGAINSDEYSTLKSDILNNKYDYTNSPADQLMKLKSWLDQKLINQDDYIAKKKKIIYGQ